MIKQKWFFNLTFVCTVTFGILTIFAFFYALLLIDDYSKQFQLTENKSQISIFYEKSAHKRFILMLNSENKKDFLEHWNEVNEFIENYPLPKSQPNSEWLEKFLEAKRLIENSTEKNYKDYLNYVESLLTLDLMAIKPDYGKDPLILEIEKKLDSRMEFTGIFALLTLIFCVLSIATGRLHDSQIIRSQRGNPS